MMGGAQLQQAVPKKKMGIDTIQMHGVEESLT
jgi:hypothetical protein